MQILLKPFINFFYNNFTKKIPEKIRDILIGTGAFYALMASFFSNYDAETFMPNWGYKWTTLWLIGVLTICIFSIDREYKPIKWNNVIIALYMLTGLLLLFVKLIFTPELRFTINSILILTVFPLMAYIWGNRKDYEKLFKIVAIAITIFAIIMIAICAKNFPHVADPMKDYHEAGNYWFWKIHNPNGVAKIFLMLIAAAIYLIKDSKSFIVTAFQALLLGFELYVTYITNARNAYLVLGAILIMIIIEFVREIAKKTDLGRLFIKSLVCILFIAIGIGAAYWSLDVRPKAEIDKIPYKESVEETEEDLTPYLEGEYDIHSTEFLKQRTAMLERDHPELTHLNDVTSDRVMLWMLYGKDMNFTGHNFVYKLETHNIFLMYAWRAGIPAGVAWFICCILMGLYMCYAFYKRQEWTWFALPIFILYFVQAMLEMGLFPLERTHILIAYICMCPCLVKSLKREEDSEEYVGKH